MWITGRRKQNLKIVLIVLWIIASWIIHENGGIEDLLALIVYALATFYIWGYVLTG